MADDDNAIYTVVVNHEEQYSIWAAGRDLPLGWRDAGKSGLKAECLAYIEEVWTDMRPASLRRAMEAAASAPPPPARPAPLDDLVDRLCEGSHPVKLVGDRLEEALREGYVHIQFTGTRGGTELGVRFDRAASLTEGPRLKFVGELTLNFEKVRCSAEVDPGTLEGQGRLERIQPRTLEPITPKQRAL